MKIGLLDHMGYGNLGDAATQEALIANIRARIPDAKIVGFSLNPDDTQMRHDIPSFSITHWHPGLNKQGLTTNSDGGALRTQLKSILKRIPILSPTGLWVRNLLRELLHLGRSFTRVRSLDSLIIAGGGQLGELWRGPWSHPYNVFKFSLLTKLANRKLLFLNVGAGPLSSRLGNVFVKCSVNLADYVSFRDVESQDLVHRLGVKRKTYVFPDSAYALDLSTYKAADRSGSSIPLVGINPIGFCDPRVWCKSDHYTYSRYLDKLAEFSQWLLGRNFGLRVFSGEASVDLYALEDLKERLRNRILPTEVDLLFLPPSRSVKDLLAEMSQLDFVVTSKFHGVVFSHLLAKPVIALSYGKKIDDLMRTVGNSQHCMSIESFDVESLKRAFTSLVEDADELKSRFRQITASRADALKLQFDDAFMPENMQLRSSELEAKRNGAVLDGSL